MLLSRNSTIALLVVLLGCTLGHVDAKEVCPIQGDQSLRYVDILDGPIQDMAILIPDEAQHTHGYWSLGYVYDAGRFVSVRCKYADGKVLEIKLLDRVERCNYKIDSKKNLTLDCK